MDQNQESQSNLVCAVNLEWQNSQQSILRRANYKSATLCLVRNEFKELFIEVRDEKSNPKYHLKDITVHNKFMSEGKASINFQHQNMVLLISNAPPAHLLMFLRSLYVKLAGDKSDSKVGMRERLLSKKSQVLQEISPVTLQEIKNAKAKSGISTTPDITPPSGSKRPRIADKNVKKKAGKKLCMTSVAPVALDPEQSEVLEAARRGQSFFFTGSAGTGKSYLLRRIIAVLPPEVTVATASTGVAACHIGGVTLHSFAGIGSGEAAVEQCVQMASRVQVQQSWRRCRHLIIDEVSMVDGDFFEKLEQVARAVRGCDRPFGGLQLILCGDFLQLAPVGRPGKKVRFCFQTPAWDRCVSACFELTRVHRQSDQAFIDVLQSVRVGRVTAEISKKLTDTSGHNIETEGILATRLCSHTKDANLINENNLSKLPGPGRCFAAQDSDPQAARQLDQQTPVPGTLELRAGAQVMLVKNISVAEGLVNGARGVVTGFGDGGFPLVRFRSRQEVCVRPDKWTVRTAGAGVLVRRQLPLKLAWAFSIHKSQGLTLDCVEMSLARVFEAGQAYVALSRARSLHTLRVVDFDPAQVWANPDVLAFYRRLRRSVQAARLVPLGAAHGR
ncbi:LOW QUALITY PROTEIN: ATP-dependent DNA helicase PIF1-like [Bacillus rossius redtenbacheri]|uniref:LOW QUALITY PROTEIN: ATP-dependent DNA helicase PIF1-like n=1 Tax=Bacillus rossius redtenbacheri TaxID=93214 RepID=UPI002FDE5DDA